MPTWPSLRTRMRRLLAGPQFLAFLPAITLAGFWIGGEAVLIAIALLMPIAFAIAGLYVTETPEEDCDALTGLPRRGAALAHADRLQRGGRSGAAAIAVSLDGLAELALQHGPAGLETIERGVADRLTGACRRGDLVARLDTGRYMVVLPAGPRVDLEAMIQISARLQRAAEEPLLLDGRRLFPTVSLGFCLPSRAPDSTAESLLDAAEHALDEALGHGPGAVRAYAPSDAPAIQTEAADADRIAEALDSGAIRPWFQPQVSATTGALTGLEALVRWEHEGQEPLPLARFLPEVERAGLLPRLTEMMVYHSFTALRGWDAEGLSIPSVSINFAPANLRDPKLADLLAWELDRFDLAPDRLRLEVLETVIAETGNDMIVRNLAALSELGCGIDLDDFGVGHASIANIKRFAVDRLKIDRSLITRVDSDPDQRSLVTAIIGLARQLGLETVAEGVESAGEHAVLIDLAADHIQGFGVSPPLPGPEIAGWLRAYDGARRSAEAAPAAPAAASAGVALTRAGKTA